MELTDHLLDIADHIFPNYPKKSGSTLIQLMHSNETLASTCHLIGQLIYQIVTIMNPIHEESRVRRQNVV